MGHMWNTVPVDTCQLMLYSTYVTHYILCELINYYNIMVYGHLAKTMYNLKLCTINVCVCVYSKCKSEKVGEQTQFF